MKVAGSNPAGRIFLSVITGDTILMSIHIHAGEVATADQIIDLDAIQKAYYSLRPDPKIGDQKVSFGTSGHRGASTKGSFNESHVLAISQAICDYRSTQGYAGPLFVGKDTHGLSSLAEKTALEVFLANGVGVVMQLDDGFVPTPVISRAIIAFNQRQASTRADGVVITPSHNPPADGGFKYNPPHGGPAESAVTSWIEARANEILLNSLQSVKRISIERGKALGLVMEQDFAVDYVKELGHIIDLERIRESGLRIGVDPLGGASLHFWTAIAEKWGLDISVVNKKIDPTFRFMRLDHDGKIRMDCSSAYAMSGLIGLKDKYDLAFGNDPDADRHGIVAPSCGLLNPNHYLAVAVRYLFTHRDQWPATLKIGKTLVSSNIIDRVASSLSREIAEVPVGFKWFVKGLAEGSYGFAGEESAGASFLTFDGKVWTTDKDGLILNLLAAELTAVTGRDPGEHFAEIADTFGMPYYTRIDCPISSAAKAKFGSLVPEAIAQKQLAGELILSAITKAPANGASIGGIKVSTSNGWFAARPSGTEDVYKIYAESFVGEGHLQSLLQEAKLIVERVLA